MLKYLVFGLVLLSTPVRADEGLCGDLGMFAQFIMQTRQKGATVDQMLSAIPEGDIKGVLTAFALQAWSRPIATEEFDKALAVEQFKNDMETLCIASTMLK